MNSGVFSHFQYDFLNLKPCFLGKPWFHMPEFLPISPSLAKHKDWKRYFVDKDSLVATDVADETKKMRIRIGGTPKFH